MRYTHPAIAQQLEVSDTGYPTWLTNGIATPATATDVLLFEIYQELQTVKAQLAELDPPAKVTKPKTTSKAAD